MFSMRFYGFAALSALFWGANFNLAGPVLADLHPLAAGAERFLLAAGIMLAAMTGRGELAATRLVARRYGGRLALLAVVGIGGFNLLFFDAMRSTSAVNGALIMATNPLVTTLLAAPLLGERPSRRQLLALPVALIGVAAVIMGGRAGRGLSVNPGDVEMVWANLAWAFYNVLSKKLMPAGSQLANITVLMAIGALVLTAVALANGDSLAVPGIRGSAALLVMALAGSVLGYLFWSMAIGGLGAGRAALFLNLVPVFAALIASLTGDLPSGTQLTGGTAVIAAVTLAMLPPRRLVAA